jgi:hypothetical protein
MSDVLREIDAELNDVSKYVRLPGRVIFDEHDEVYFVDADGRPCSPRDEGAKKKVRRFDRKRLEEIAARCNARDATGSLSPLAIGHTVPDRYDDEGNLIERVPEDKQPEGVGYARRYSVAYDGSKRRHVLKTDFYVRRERMDYARSFPRVSVELWDKHGVIDPISLLRRTPARDIGQWTYGRDGLVLRYSRELQMDEPIEGDDLALPGGAPGADAPPEPSHEEKLDQYMRHCYSHPHAGYVAQHYAMPAEGADLAPPADPMGAEPADPTAPPDAGGDEPIMNSAASATNGGIPRQHARKGPRSQAAMDAERIQYSRERRELEELRKKVAGLEKANAEETARRYVTQLVGEGYELDADEEVRQFAALGEPERVKRADHVRRYYRQAPVGYAMPVPTADRRKEDGDDRPGVVTDGEHFERALQYSRRLECGWEEAVAKTKNK